MFKPGRPYGIVAGKTASASLLPFLLLGLMTPAVWAVGMLAGPNGTLGRPAWVSLASLAGAVLLAYGLGWPSRPRLPRDRRSWTPLIAGGLFALLAAGGHVTGTDWLFPTSTDDGNAMGAWGLAVQAGAILLSLRLREGDARFDGRHTAAVVGTFLLAQWPVALAWSWPWGTPASAIDVDSIELIPVTLATTAALLVGLASARRLHLALRRGIALLVPVGVVALDLYTRGILFLYVLLPVMVVVFPAARELWIEETGPSGPP